MILKIYISNSEVFIKSEYISHFSYSHLIFFWSMMMEHILWNDFLVFKITRCRLHIDQRGYYLYFHVPRLHFCRTVLTKPSLTFIHHFSNCCSVEGIIMSLPRIRNLYDIVWSPIFDWARFQNWLMLVFIRVWVLTLSIFDLIDDLLKSSCSLMVLSSDCFKKRFIILVFVVSFLYFQYCINKYFY